MTKSVFFIIFSFSFAVSSYGQNDGPQFTAKSKGLFGKIKSVISTTNTIEIGGNNSITERILYAYKNIFYRNGFIDSSFSKIRDGEFILDYHYFWKKDTLTSTVHPNGYIGTCVFNKNELPIYDCSNRINEQKTERWFTYDKNQKLLVNIWKVNGKFDTVSYKYSITNNITFKVIIRHTAKQFFEPVGCYYLIDSNFHKLFEVRPYSDKIHKTETKYTYDNFGNLLKQEELMFVKNKNVWQKEPASKKRVDEYRYLYDEQNNWIQKEKIVNSIPSEIERRIITYW